jgi:hypothetical protein
MNNTKNLKTGNKCIIPMNELINVKEVCLTANSIFIIAKLVVHPIGYRNY